MLRRAVSSCLLLLVAACPAGPGTSTGSDTGSDTGTSTGATGTSGGSSTGALPTTSEATTTGDATSDATTGALTDTGTATSDTTATTTTTTITTTDDGTTGAAACEDIVGSMDCPALVAVSGDLTLEQCMLCQGATCGEQPECDGNYPCVDGKIVLRGCCTDEQCAGLSPFCGMFIATNNVCVLNDDI